MDNLQETIDQYLDNIPEELPLEQKYERYVDKFSAQERIQFMLDELEKSEEHYWLLDHLADFLENGTDFSKVFDKFLENLNML
jgi:hypothetical protein